MTAADSSKKRTDLPVLGSESIMSKKKHGTSATPVQANLRWECDRKTADRICNFNVRACLLPLITTCCSPLSLCSQRHYAEHSGYFQKTPFLKEAPKELHESKAKEITFYDSNTGKPLFYAPRNRSWDEFVRESKAHGWPSFRDDEVNWDFVRCLKNGEAVSVDGTHLGHNLPDRRGNRYCINLVSVAGLPTSNEDAVRMSF